MTRLDYLFLWSVSVDSAKYFLQLEDDILANRNFLTFIDTEVKKTEKINKKWISIEFCSLGFIGKLFKKQSLESLLTYSRLFFKDKPIDWIYWSFVHMKSCLPGWDMKKCKASSERVSRNVSKV